MNGKVIAAFVAGAVMASGIVYLAVRPTPLPTIARKTDVRLPEVPAPAPPAIDETTPPPEATVRPSDDVPKKDVPKKPAQRAKLSSSPIREKPSPMPPPVHRQEPATVARNEAKPEPVAPPPQVEPAPSAPVDATPAPTLPPPPTPAPAPEPPPPPPGVVSKQASPIEPRVPHQVILAAGTRLTVRIAETVSAARSQAGDTFVATLEQPLVIDGFIICERGSRVLGKVSNASPAGRGGGSSHLSLELVRLSTSDNQRVPIHTEAYVRDSSGSAGSDLAKIGAGAAIGAAIGAIAGGGKGAAIGAGAGAAAGTGVVLATNGRSVEVPVEARVTFRVKDAVTITEKLD